MVAKVVDFSWHRDTKHAKPQSELADVVVFHENFAEFSVAVFSCEMQSGVTAVTASCRRDVEA